MGTTQKQRAAAIRRLGRELRIAGPRFKWEVQCGFETDDDSYPFRDQSEASLSRGDADAWGGHLTDRNELYRQVRMGRGASVQVFTREDWGWRAIGCFYFTLPNDETGDIKVDAMLDQGNNGAKSVPFCKG